MHTNFKQKFFLKKLCNSLQLAWLLQDKNGKRGSNGQAILPDGGIYFFSTFKLFISYLLNIFKILLLNIYQTYKNFFVNKR